MPNVTVTKANRKIAVSHPTVQVSVSKRETVKWVSPDGHFRIQFKAGSNWQNPETTQDGDSHVAECGPFDKPQKLSYSVVADGHEDLDPDIDVRP